MRSGLIGVINCLIFWAIPSADKENSPPINPITGTQSSAFTTALGTQGHQVLFLSNTDGSLFAWVLSVFEVGLRGGDGGEKECEFSITDSTHTCSWPFEGPPNTCCFKWMERQVSKSETSLISVESDPAELGIQSQHFKDKLRHLKLYDNHTGETYFLLSISPSMKTTPPS